MQSQLFNTCYHESYATVRALRRAKMTERNRIPQKMKRNSHLADKSAEQKDSTFLIQLYN